MVHPQNGPVAETRVSCLAHTPPPAGLSWERASTFSAYHSNRSSVTPE